MIPVRHALVRDGALYVHGAGSLTLDGRHDQFSTLYRAARERGVTDLWIAPASGLATGSAGWWDWPADAGRLRVATRHGSERPAVAGFRDARGDWHVTDLGADPGRWPLDTGATRPADLLAALHAIGAHLGAQCRWSPGTTGLAALRASINPYWLDEDRGYHPAESHDGAGPSPLRWLRPLAALPDDWTRRYLHIWDMNAAYLACCQGISINGHRMLRLWADRVWAARRVCEGANLPAGVAIVKAIYTKTFGRLRSWGTDTDEPHWSYRPHWHDAIVAECRRRVETTIDRLAGEPGWTPVLANVDTIGALHPSVLGPRKLLWITHRHDQIGGYRRVRSVCAGRDAIREAWESGSVGRVLAAAAAAGGSDGAE